MPFINQPETGRHWFTLRSELFIDFPQPIPLLQKSETGVMLSTDVEHHNAEHRCGAPQSHFPQLCIKLNLVHMCLKPQRDVCTFPSPGGLSSNEG